ncbi:DUF6169 family protein [Bacteroides sp. An51A]|uniref:DUF6169 family protein n=1 Tax=Bacteroides sp. An51A TaxID=1965640 RepID=UPI000B376A02|nr:DUF6169 family protein [Bacteroides sp. An51A]OUN77330.1 hypothetical protein B5G04_17480 [Bacteroides sp. An51A]
MVKIDLERVNASAPYIFTPAPFAPLSYVLTTDYGVMYSFSFVPDELLPGIENVYEFIISNVNHRKSPGDRKLLRSVYALIYEFFSQPDAVMIYLCDTSDGKQEVRQRLFVSWFYSADRKYSFNYLSSTITDDEGVENIVALLFRIDHPRAVQISGEFARAVQLFHEKPE